MSEHLNYNELMKLTAGTMAMLPTRHELLTQIKLFGRSNRIVFCTMGKSAFACRKIVHVARSYGLEWYDLDVCHAFHGDAGIIRPRDLLVFISKSGNTNETVKVADYFRTDHMTVAMCSDKDSWLAVNCEHNIHIPVPKEGSPFGFAPMVSTIMYGMVLNAILCEVVVARGCTVEQYAANHPDGDIGRRARSRVCTCTPDHPPGVMDTSTCKIHGD